MQTRKINPWTWQDQFGFAHAVEVTGGERVVHCAGQGSVDDDGAPVHAGDVAGQIGKSLDNLERVLSDAGLGLSDVVRLTYYTTDMEAFFGAMGTLVERLDAAGCRPASTLVEVARLAYPEMLVEIEATAAA
jgi:enamine deaminase RidA (YjgF/YER057c/UK114 family)